MQRVEHLVITHRRAVGTMHQPAWVGIDMPPSTDESTVLAQMGARGWQLVAVNENRHSTEVAYYFARALD